jgi:hypothetical protein
VLVLVLVGHRCAMSVINSRAAIYPRPLHRPTAPEGAFLVCCMNYEHALALFLYAHLLINSSYPAVSPEGVFLRDAWVRKRGSNSVLSGRMTRTRTRRTRRIISPGYRKRSSPMQRSRPAMVWKVRSVLREMMRVQQRVQQRSTSTSEHVNTSTRRIISPSSPYVVVYPPLFMYTSTLWMGPDGEMMRILNKIA